MRRTACWAPLTLTVVLVSTAARADSWSSLWTTPEQRAQHLLDSGRPQEAARLFKDPRRRAYAELKAGRYDEAAQLLKPLSDEQSQYNRGNTLAHAGDLPSALAAYDAALKEVPGDRDARHNRDLVARELEQRTEQSSGKGNSQQQNGTGPRSGNGQSQGDQEKGSKGQGQNGQPGGKSGSPGNDQTGSSPSDSDASAGQGADQAQRDAELAARMQRNPARTGSQSQVGGTGRARGNDSSGPDIVGRATAQAEADLPPPKSEQTLALEQWLRRIPDDPGGLLRRKFLIEHIERQQAAQAQGQGADADQ